MWHRNWGSRGAINECPEAIKLIKEGGNGRNLRDEKGELY